MKELYWTVASKWHSIGTFLEISNEELCMIAERERNDPQKCLMAMLSVWLHRTNVSKTPAVVSWCKREMIL